MHAFACIFGWSWLAIAFAAIEPRKFDLVHIQYLIHTSRVRSNFVDTKIVVNIGFAPRISVRVLHPSTCVILAAGVVSVLVLCCAGARVLPLPKLSSDLRVKKKKEKEKKEKKKRVAIHAWSGHLSDPVLVLPLNLYHRCVLSNPQALFFQVASP